MDMHVSNNCSRFAGIPILYHGSELGNAYKADGVVPAKKLYPKGKKAFPDLGNDSVSACYLPMPWDRRGSDFSDASIATEFETFLTSHGIWETVHVSSVKD